LLRAPGVLFDFLRRHTDDHLSPAAKSPSPNRPPPAASSPVPTPAPAAAVAGAGGTTAGTPRGFNDPALHAPTEAQLHDRALARDELAKKFQVIGPDFAGDRAPNQVTAAEYDKVVNNYSDIRTGNSNVKLDAGGLPPEAAQAFRGGTLEDIVRILQTGGGRSVIDQLGHAQAADGSARTTTISPNNGLDEKNGWDHFAPTWWEGGDAAKVTTPGAGANALVAHHPGEAWPEQMLSGGQSDVSLYYHLLGAMNAVSGNVQPSDKDHSPKSWIEFDEKWHRSSGNWENMGPDGIFGPLSTASYRNARGQVR